MKFLPTIDWLCPKAVVPLEPDAVQVWLVEACDTGSMAYACRSWLSDDELQRHSRMRAGIGRDEFLIGRGCLRALVGAALDQDPGAVRFSLGAHGKPSVAGLEFNVSHAHGAVLIALSLTHRLGVDLEWIDRKIEALDIARGTFAPLELRAIEASSDREGRAAAFYRCWTRKEAVVKAHGQGLSFPLASFAVSTDLAEKTEVQLVANRDGGNFFVGELKIGEGFIGALAVDAADVTVQQFLLTADLLASMQSSLLPSCGQKVESRKSAMSTFG